MIIKERERALERVKLSEREREQRSERKRDVKRVKEGSDGV